MSLDELQARLVAELKPSPPHYVLRRLLAGAGAGAAVSAVLIVAVLGYRPDMPHAMVTNMFWIKLGYMLALAAVALWSAERLARPGEAGWGRTAWFALPLLLAVGLAAWRLAQAPPPMRHHMIMGDSARGCSWLIMAASIAPLIGLVWAVRGLAPTRLVRTGAIIGLAAGGVGAAAYALHCPEFTAPFLAVWYTAGVAGSGLVGALLGPVLLRWK